MRGIAASPRPVGRFRAACHQSPCRLCVRLAIHETAAKPTPGTASNWCRSACRHYRDGPTRGPAGDSSASMGVTRCGVGVGTASPRGSDGGFHLQLRLNARRNVRQLGDPQFRLDTCSLPAARAGVGAWSPDSIDRPSRRIKADARNRRADQLIPCHRPLDRSAGDSIRGRRHLLGRRAFLGEHGWRRRRQIIAGTPAAVWHAPPPASGARQKVKRRLEGLMSLPAAAAPGISSPRASLGPT